MSKQPEPIVTLVSWTNNPIKAVASQLLNMQGRMVHNLDDISEDEALKLLKDLKRTALAGGLEVIDMLFQIENVPRSLTHQLVRTRVGATYHQESLRFTTRADGFDYDIGPTIRTEEQKDWFESSMEILADSYKNLVNLGVSMEDARGVLPISTLTKVGVKYNFKTLVHTSHVRLCFQSQGHWMKIFKMIKKEISEKISPELASFLQPICEVSGRCEYKGIFDRVCPKEARLISKTCEGCILSNMCEFTNEDIKESACAALKKYHRLDW